MKKIVALLLMSVMMLALTGCGGSDKKDEKAAGSDKKVVLKLSHVFSPDGGLGVCLAAPVPLPAIFRADLFLFVQHGRSQCSECCDL